MADEEDPMAWVEMLAAINSLAKGTREFYTALVESGFETAEAMKLTCAYVAGGVGGFRG